jgi:protein transport protein SEC13
MASASVVVDTQHDDMIHDVQFDYYGKRAATCSSDKTIKIIEVGDNNTHLADLKGHEGPVWQVAWAHPKFCSILASCSYDRKVYIWKEVSTNVWNPIYVYPGHELSVNSISWAPHEYGLILACASADGTISIQTYKDNNTWEAERFPAHKIGVNAVSWAPAVAPASLISSASPKTPAQRRIVSGGCDKLVTIWSFNEADNKWEAQHQLSEHSDWVRDVAWAPNIGLPTSTIASCSQDGTVIIWTQEDPNSAWVPKVLSKFSDVVWRVSWSVTGNILAVTGGDNKVTMWKEGLDGEWKCIQTIDESE